MNAAIERIKQYYGFRLETNPDTLFVVAKGKGEKRILQADRDFYFTFGHKGDVKDLLNQGLAVNINCLDLYAHLFEWSEEELFEARHKMERSAYETIQKIEQAAGLSAFKYADEPVTLQNMEQVKMNYEEAELGQLDDKWVVQDYRSNGIDDTWVALYYFSSKPTQSQIDLAYEINEIKIGIQIYGHPTSFHYEDLSPSGRRVHISELKGAPMEICRQFANKYVREEDE